VKGIRGVLFDMDGTLLDSENLSLEATNFGFREVLGRETTDEESSKLIGRPISKVLEEWFPDKGHEIYSTGRAFFNSHLDRIRMYPGVREMILKLQQAGYKLGVVSSSHRSDIAKLLGSAGVLQYMETFVGQEDTIYQKPDPEPLNLALKRMMLRPEEAVYVGDQPYDIIAAHGAGLRAIGAVWGTGLKSQLEAYRPDFIVDSPASLTALIVDP